MIEPLKIELTVRCSVEHAFEVWFRRISTWWPRTHRRSQSPRFDVVVEEEIGGRIYERTPDGEEYDWGRVTDWDPPHRAAYLWHIYGPADNATDVEITFSPAGEATLVRIVQTGFERLGPGGGELREGNKAGWAAVVSHFQDAC